MQIAANPGKLYSTTGSTTAHVTRRNSLRPFTFGKFYLRPPEPKVTGSNPVGDTYDIRSRIVTCRAKCFSCKALRRIIGPQLFSPFVGGDGRRRTASILSARSACV